MSRTCAAAAVAAGLGGLSLLGWADTMSWHVRPGMRAVSIATDCAPSGVNIEPGDRFDLFVTYDDPSTGQKLTKMILQNVLVLFLDKQKADSSGKEGAAGWIMLEVKAEQAEFVIAADRSKALRISWSPVGNQRVPVVDVIEVLSTNQLRRIALEHLSGRYPNIERTRFLFQSITPPPSVDPSSGQTVVFVQKDAIEKGGNEPGQYQTQYLVRLKPNGELIDIQQQERHNGILKITPAPDSRDTVQPTIITPP